MDLTAHANLHITADDPIKGGVKEIQPSASRRLDSHEPEEIVSQKFLPLLTTRTPEIMRRFFLRIFGMAGAPPDGAIGASSF